LSYIAVLGSTSDWIEIVKGKIRNGDDKTIQSICWLH